ncbi:hypothetical protein UY3_16618 [Chelonia mydas]|uniref:Uncharacterized protein n=1 Tax=Chelonia mydas TaxID=8469 RepID=M7AM76_CHEMY|nr:hypothetical protein UY3_16618 [Chelonia mydas]
MHPPRTSSPRNTGDGNSQSWNAEKDPGITTEDKWGVKIPQKPTPGKCGKPCRTDKGIMPLAQPQHTGPGYALPSSPTTPTLPQGALKVRVAIGAKPVGAPGLEHPLGKIGECSARPMNDMIACGCSEIKVYVIQGLWHLSPWLNNVLSTEGDPPHLGQCSVRISNADSVSEFQQAGRKAVHWEKHRCRFNPFVTGLL